MWRSRLNISQIKGYFELPLVHHIDIYKCDEASCGEYRNEDVGYILISDLCRKDILQSILEYAEENGVK